MLQQWRLLTLLPLFLLLLTGCDDGPAAVTALPPTPTITPFPTASPTPAAISGSEGAQLLAEALVATGRADSYTATHDFSLIQDDANQVGARGSCERNVEGSICATELASLVNGETSRQSGLTLQRGGRFWYAADPIDTRWTNMSARDANLPGYVNGVIDPLPFLDSARDAELVLREVVDGEQDQLALSVEVDVASFLLLLLGEAQAAAILEQAADIDSEVNVWLGADDRRIYRLQATFSVLRAAGSLTVILQQRLSGYDEPVEIPPEPRP